MIFASNFFRRELETVSVAVNIVTFVAQPVLGWSLFLYFLTTRFWWLALCYLGWIIIDRRTLTTGGRPIPWIQNLKYLQLARDYFPLKLTIPPDVTLNSKKNYLFCCVPHGILAMGPFYAVIIGKSDFRRFHPNFKTHIAVVEWLGYTPFLREWGLALGLISCSAKSLSYLLSRSEGGYIVNLMIGGAAEAYHSHPGQYKLVIKKRKGFVKVALATGADLVPVVTFGESDLFYQVDSTRIRPVQDFIKRFLRYVPILFYGRWYSIIPRRLPLRTVLGKPIEVTKVENPTQQQIDELHQTFTRHLVDLFEEYKYQFLEKPEDTVLELE